MYKTKNGWTKEKILDAIVKYVPDTPEGCTAYPLPSCLYYDPVTRKRCGVGALLPFKVAQSMPDDTIRAAYKRPDGSVLDLTDHLPFSVQGLQQLQKTHDDGKGPNARARCMEWVHKNIT